MSEFGVSELIPVLQTAIGPVILISGVGLLLLTMTNRLGRVIDRARWIDEGYPDLPEDEKAQKRVCCGGVLARSDFLLPWLQPVRFLRPFSSLSFSPLLCCNSRMHGSSASCL